MFICHFYEDKYKFLADLKLRFTLVGLDIFIGEIF